MLHHSPGSFSGAEEGALDSARGSPTACPLLGKKAALEPTWVWGFFVLVVSAECLLDLGPGDLAGRRRTGGLAALELRVLLLQQALRLFLALKLLQAPLLLLLLGGKG